MDAKTTPKFDPAALPPSLIGHMEPDYEALADAYYWSEGGAKTKHPYGIMIPTKDEFQARHYAINTFRNNFKRWQEAGKRWAPPDTGKPEGPPITYFEFNARRFTPPKDDPKGHANSLVNVPAIYSQYITQPDTNANPPGYAPSSLPKYKAP